MTGTHESRQTDFGDLRLDEQIAQLASLALAALAQWDARFHGLTLVKYRENAVFSVFDSAGQRYAVRVHRTGYHSDEALASELEWVDALAGGGLLVPQAVPSRSGELFVSVASSAAARARQVDVLRWIDGRPIGSIETPEPQSFQNIGQLAARLHLHAAGWKRPNGFVRHAWDEDGLIGPDPLWGRFWEHPDLAPDQRRLLERARSCASADLAAYGKSVDNFGLIHADYLPENILSTPDGLAIIDFDDAGFGWFLYDIATALIFSHGGASANVQSFAEGYRRLRTLAEHDLARLPLFLFLRASSYVGWIQTRSEASSGGNFSSHLIELACGHAKTYLEQCE